MQRLLHQDARVSTKPLERAQVVRAWCDLNEEIRKLAMRAVPKPIDTTKHGATGRRSRSTQAAPVEPVEPAVPVVKAS